MDDIFIREDLSRPENRINVAMFGLMTEPRFASWLLARLGMPATAVLYPPQNTANDGGAGRPDFVIRSAFDGDVIGYVEVETVKNTEQIERFRRMFPTLPVVALWGRPGDGCDLSLEEVAAFLETASRWESAQSRINADHLRLLIRDALAGARSSTARAQVGSSMWESPFVLGLRDVLGDRLERTGSPNLHPRDIRIDTTDSGPTNMGFSIRVYSPKSSRGKSVSILNRSGGRPSIRFSSKAWLRYYLPAHHAIIDELCTLVDEMGGDMIQDWRPGDDSSRPTARFADVSLARAEARVADVARMVARLADRPA